MENKKEGAPANYANQQNLLFGRLSAFSYEETT
jgi:hypothetical protein